MPQPLSDYFALEAGEFLDQLDTLLRRPEAPDPVQFFRLARGVRGSAQIAGADGVAAVAERLEDGARALRDGILHWSDELRERALRTAEDLRALVAAHGEWGEAEEARAGEAVERWGDAVGSRRRADQPATGDQLFAFVRREIVVVVAELDRVLEELERTPAAGDALRLVLRRMRPVRGVAGLDALAPVLEVLEGIEDTAHDVLSRAAPATRPQLELLRAGRDGLHAAGGALERGGALDELPEVEHFRELREGADGTEGDAEAGVVPITRLFFDDDGPHIVSSPAAPVAEQEGHASVPEEVESFLRIEATGFLDRAEGLISGPPGRAGRRFGRVARQLAELAASVRELAGTYGLTATAAA
ncbi:MAG TPA: Hpt domain-containing protein, partial [Longimicrobiaceae bacterium]|nr:Hpt domain-containing protein [Longimicrobiaceae bacterium]